ncbi:unnamed protein product [Absidia cylindrospora]
MDELHLLGLGIGKHLKEIFLENSRFAVQSTLSGNRRAKYPFQLDGIRMADVGKAMKASRLNIPSSFSGNWDDVTAKTFRAVDWMDFLLYALPCLVVPNIIDFRARKHMRNLIMVCDICKQWSISEEDIEFVKVAIQGVHLFISLRVAKTPSEDESQYIIENSIFTVTLHYLGHLFYILTELGPMPAYSCRSLERTIGIYKKKRPSGTATNASYQIRIEDEVVNNYKSYFADNSENVTTSNSDCLWIAVSSNHHPHH